MEASATWWWLGDLLERLGHQPVLSHPKRTKTIVAARLKNDRVDTERLALLLRGDCPRLDSVSTASQAHELIRHRITLVWLRTRIKNQLQSLGARRKLRPTSTKHWMSARGQQELVW
jgi:Transposase